MYKDKYIKYKTKYLALKNIIQYGGRDGSISGSVVLAAATKTKAIGMTGGGGGGGGS